MIDLRSDTVNVPTPEMYAAMAAAPLGDDGWRDDPTVLQLERLAAERLRKPAALFLPSGTMANLAALMVYGGHGGEVLAEARSHIIAAELGGIATVAGLSFRPIPGRRGAMDLDYLEAAVRADVDDRSLHTALICLENTHTAESGAVLPLAYMADVKRLATMAGLPVHLDGARLFNAAVALGVDVAELSEHSDSVAISLCKALGAPAGAILAGSTHFIKRALVYRKMLGGTMRQAGLLAACGIVGLQRMVERLADDHERARQLADALRLLDDRLVDLRMVDTNLVTVAVRHTGRNAREWADALKCLGVLVAPLVPWHLRLITHRDIGVLEVRTAVDAFGKIRAKCPAPQQVPA
jgi:threonine aldolase